MTISPALQAIIESQYGIATRRQLFDDGVTRSALRAALGRTWRAVLPGVIATFTGPLTQRQRLTAAVLYAGSGARLTGIEACRSHGLCAVPAPGRTVFVVPEWRCRRSAGWVKVFPTTRLDGGNRTLDGVPVVSAARAVVDAAPDLDGPGAIEALVLECVQRRFASASALRHELELAPVRNSRWLRRAVLAAEDGAWSRPEADLLRILQTSVVLPTVFPNPVLVARDGTRLPTPDGWIPGVGVAVQVHSRKYHAGDADFDATLDGDGMLASHGAVVIPLTPRRIQQEPAAVLARVERTYIEREAAGIRVDIRMLRRAQ